MDTVANPTILSTINFDNKIRANDLLAALDHFAPSIKVLSLDCFDTIIWRKTATPVDVFFDLQQHSIFKELGFTAALRIRSESNARLLKVIESKSTEVTLQDIYKYNFPQMSNEQIQILEQTEINAEIEALYAFTPMLELMRKAYTLGLKIILVSDTYLKESQLRHILHHHLPDDVYKMIDKIFCSCDHGVSKVNGIFKNVISHLGCSPQTILHLGDNHSADYNAPKVQNINALHFVQQEEGVQELLRIQASAACLMDPSIRNTRGLVSPFKAMLATATIDTQKPEQMIGYASVGPVMYTFARFIQEEVAELKRNGQRPKVLFLLRDAYLASQVCEAIAGEGFGRNVSISRFAALAASFRTKDDILRYLSEVVFTGRFRDIARQLLLPESISEPIVTSALSTNNPYFHFIDAVTQQDRLDFIFKKSAEYRGRLKQHLRMTIGLEEGDTLVFVDLGYSGTAQRLLEPIFREELKIEITGRYLIALSVPDWKHSRRGLLDPSWCDNRILLSLIAYIALLEQICTSSGNSVIDYDDQGNPLFANTSVTEQQHTKLHLIQNECIRFAKDAANYFSKSTTSFTVETLRDVVLAELSRMIYLPLESEIQHLQSFEFDLNLGTNDIYNLFDQSKGLASLRKRGMFFSSMEKIGKSMRTNYPAELRAAGLEHALSFITHHRFGLEFALRDTTMRREAIKVIAMLGNQSSQLSIEAQSTYDGYYSLCIPVNTGNIHIGLLFGQKYQWVQIYSVELINTQAFLQSREQDNTEDCWSSVTFQHMFDRGGRLFECTSDTSLAMISPPLKNTGFTYLLRVTFRPITMR